MDADVVDLQAQGVLLRRRWQVIALVTLLGLAAAGALAYFQTPTYVATSEVLVDPLTAQTPTNGVIVQPDEVATQIQVIASEPVASAVRTQLGLSDSPDQLLRSVVVSPVDVTRALTISVTRSSASEAADIANAFATQYLAYRQTRNSQQVSAARAAYDQQFKTLQDELSTISTQLQTATGGAKAALQSRQQALLIQLTQASSQLNTLDTSGMTGGQVLRPATVPSSPASPKIVRMLVLGGVLGLLLGVGLAYVRDRLDDKVRDETRLRDILAGRPILGYIPHWSGSRSDRIATLIEPHSPTSEAYRSLSTNVRFLLAASRTPGSAGAVDHTLLVSSASQAEGKTSVSANLAVAAARVGLRVILVDADLRNPRLSSLLGIGDSPGLSDALVDGESVEEYLLDVGVEHLRVLPGGSAPPNPAELLASPAAHAILRRLKSDCDLLILDSAPVLRVADSLELIPSVDIVLLVVRNGVSRLRQVAAAVDRIRQVGGPVSGAVFNDVDARDGNYSYAYHPPTGDAILPAADLQPGSRTHSRAPAGHGAAHVRLAHADDFD